MAARTVLYILPNSAKGGAEQLTGLMLRHHDSARWRGIAYFFGPGPFVEELSGMRTQDGRTLEIRVSRQSARPRLRHLGNVWRFARELALIIREEKVDLVHSAMGYGHLFGGLAARMAGVPEVWYQHGPTGTLDWLTGRVPSACVLVNSRYTKAEQRRYRAWSRQGSALVIPATETVALAPLLARREVERAAWGVRPSEILVAHFGRITVMKGQRLFLAAAARVAARIPEARFLVIGSPFRGDDPAYAAGLRELARTEGLAERVIFRDYVPDPRGLMAASEIVVNSSIVPEPFGLTIIEAMAVARPVIAPRAGGPLEIFVDGQAGVFFRPGDAVDLAARIGELARDSARRERLGRAGRAAVEGRFSPARMTRELEAIYDETLATS